MKTWIHSSGVEVNGDSPWRDYDWTLQHWTSKTGYYIKTSKDEAFTHHVFLGTALLAKFILKPLAQQYIDLLEAKE